MSIHRYLIALLTSTILTTASAFAAPPPGVSVGVGAGAHGNVGIGAPPVGVPPAHVPPLTIPPVNVPKPQNAPPANANAHAAVNANASLAAASVMHGTLTSIAGTAVTIQLSNGATQTYTVSSQTAARLQAFLKKNIAFRVQNGTLAFVGAGTPPLHGTLTSVSGTTAQIKLPNGATQSYTVTAQQAAWLQAHVGKAVAFWTNANGTIELNQSSHRSSTAARRPARRHTH